MKRRTFLKQAAGAVAVAAVAPYLPAVPPVAATTLTAWAIGAPLVVGSIIECDSELLVVTSVRPLRVERGRTWE